MPLRKRIFNKEDQLLIDKVDERIEQHMKKLGIQILQEFLQFKQLRSYLELWYLNTTYELRCWNQRMIEILRNGFFKYVIRNSI